MSDGRRGVRLAAVVVALVAVGAAVLGGGAESPTPGDLGQSARTVDPAALATSACSPVPPGDVDDRDHVDTATAPPPAVLYDTELPAAGPHFPRWVTPADGLPPTPLDVRAVLHNLEHGAVVVWLDDARLGGATLAAVEDWRDQLGAAGFDHDDTGAAVLVSRMPGHVTDDGPVVALRAWGVALDCSRWDLAVADAFVGLHYGTRGDAPEADLGPWPSGNGVLVGPPGADDGTTTTV